MNANPPGEYGSILETDVLLRPTCTPAGKNDITKHYNNTISPIKTQASTFFEDARAFAPGSIPHSMVLALTIGIVCGVACWLYYTAMLWGTAFVWKTLPVWILGSVKTEAAATEHWWYVFWIPIVSFTMALLLGLTTMHIGDPRDVAYVINCVHEKAFVAMDHIMPMGIASLFSMMAGGSLGPEAPLLGICAALGGCVSKTVFGINSRNLIRKHTLMGMAGALSAFFGVPLGGSIFALEINSRFSVEYFEHTVEAIFCGEICLAVFRQLAGLPIGPIWNITPDEAGSSAKEILYGMLLGLVGACVALLFVKCHKFTLAFFRKLGMLDDNNLAVRRALLGTVVIALVGMIIPHTMFFGDVEFQTVATLSPASTLKRVWPTSGLIGFEVNSFWTSLIFGVAKLLTISVSVGAGYRGGYIFPVFVACAGLGRALYFLCPFLPVQLCILCLAASVNVALTRTAIGTPLILSCLSNEPNSLPSILAASLVSLFFTGYMSFIPTQAARHDIHEAIFFSYTTTDYDVANINGCDHDNRVSGAAIHVVDSSLSSRLSRNLNSSLPRFSSPSRFSLLHVANGDDDGEQKESEQFPHITETVL